MQTNIRATFVAAIALSAFLLFTLELVAGRLVLPVFGGSPGVWATTLCFFTAILFIGYGYAHLVATRLTPAGGGALQLVLAVVAALGLVLAPANIADLRNPALPDAVNVLLAQLMIAGPAAFVLASTTPLLSAWYGRLGFDPWWLYAASNGASFIALIAYPFVIAPTIGLAAQRGLLVAGVTGYAILIAVIVVANRRLAPARQEVVATEPTEPLEPTAPGSEVPDAGRPTLPRIPIRRQAVWLFAAFVPAGLLSATTNFIATDLISAPLLWVGPLGIYLLSFVIAFSARGQRLVSLAIILVPTAAALLWIPSIALSSWPILVTLAVEFLAFLMLAVAIHGRLAADRPDTGNLTRFYLLLAAGGMLATAFVALVAPLVFDAVYEYPILIVAALVAIAILPAEGARTVSTNPRDMLVDGARRLVPYVLATAVLLVLISGGSLDKVGPALGLFVIGAYAIAIAVWPQVLPVSVGLAIVFATLNHATPTLFQTRTFFGVLRVASNGIYTTESSGTTLHGAQYRDERRTEPTAYYTRKGPMGRVLADLQARNPSLSIGVVGLGVGTTMAYDRPSDKFTFFEIDQAVIDAARDPRYFTYLSDAPGPPRIVQGDGRLSLTNEPSGAFDVLILDAFASDAVPVHLLTREAMSSYARTLKPGGVMLFHLSNRYYRLEPAVVATARAAGLAGLSDRYDPVDADSAAEGSASIWAIVGRAEDVARYAGAGWSDPGPGPVLTDDYSDLLGSLRP